MTVDEIRFQIDQLRKEKMVYAIESIMVFIASFFVIAFLPGFLYRYMYANQQLLEEPKVMQYIPLVAFGIAIAFFIYAVLKNFMACLKIKRLEKQLSSGEVTQSKSSSKTSRSKSSKKKSTTKKKK